MTRTVLIIDDSEAVQTKLEEALIQAGVFAHCLRAGNGIEGFKALISHDVDLVLCDLVMPEFDGFKFLSLKRGRKDLSDIPVLMLTGQEDVQTKVRGLEAGASDYLIKPFFPEELVARVRVHLKLKVLQDELREKNERLERLSRTDELTGLFNRRYFMEQLRTELERSQRYEGQLVFAMVDIDHFKKVNDTYGHLAGDRALAETSATLRAGLRTQDMLGRYGGEEFGLFMPQTDLAGAQDALERFRKCVEASVITCDHHRFQVTLSIGLAAYPRPDVHRVEDLIALADAALYRAKKNGRNQLMVADAPPSLAQSLAAAAQAAH